MKVIISAIIITINLCLCSLQSTCPNNIIRFSNQCNCQADFANLFQLSQMECQVSKCLSYYQTTPLCHCNSDGLLILNHQGLCFTCVQCPANSTVNEQNLCVCNADMYATGQGETLSCNPCPENSVVNPNNPYSCNCQQGFQSLIRGNYLIQCIKCPPYSSFDHQTGTCQCNPPYYSLRQGHQMICLLCKPISQQNLSIPELYPPHHYLSSKPLLQLWCIEKVCPTQIRCCISTFFHA